MPWRETSPMDQRRLFINDYRHSVFPFAELCARYGISRKTGYKWVSRFLGGGYPALEDMSRRPRNCSHRTPADDGGGHSRRAAPPSLLGSKEALKLCRRRQPKWSWPARSTICSILKRNGLVPESRRRRQPWASRSAHEADECPERDLDRGLQGRIQDPRRAVLLSLDGRRWIQPLSARVSGPAQSLPRGHGIPFHATLQGIRPAAWSFAPTTALLSPASPSAGSLVCPSGGSSWGSSRN